MTFLIELCINLCLFDVNELLKLKTINRKLQTYIYHNAKISVTNVEKVKDHSMFRNFEALQKQLKKLSVDLVIADPFEKHEIQNITSLHSLKIIGEDFDWSVLKSFVNLKNFCYFVSDRTFKNFSPGIVEELTSLTKLVFMGHSSIKDFSLRKLVNLEILQLENLYNVKNHYIEDLTNLHTLTLNDSNSGVFCTTYQGVNIYDYQLEKLTGLTRLDLNNNSTITSAGIKNLNIKSLSLNYNTTITSEGIRHLHLKSISLGSNKLISNDVISKMTQLESISLDSNEEINDLTLEKLTNLRLLELRDNDTITNKSVSLLTKLTFLDLGNNKNITSEALVDMLDIRHLSLYANDIIGSGSISHMTKIIDLNLNGNKIISDVDLKNITNVVHLTLWGDKIPSVCKVTFDYVSRLSKLKTICLIDNHTISAENREELKAKGVYVWV
ncbi:MAG: hypothetical protein Hyperionvirus3_122 [Hyperionvirus sp.]|uniref:Leucine-rich repeat protein n=1 Tax=Hyperionvirus sp. TaxID=2487770 RepID=A0A3G5A6U4_9VIRU|nr:MAG: hypothetical protein Hyperionvirus3_122 [Hyperionvirus sp.]